MYSSLDVSGDNVEYEEKLFKFNLLARAMRLIVGNLAYVIYGYVVFFCVIILVSSSKNKLLKCINSNLVNLDTRVQ